MKKLIATLFFTLAIVFSVFAAEKDPWSTDLTLKRISDKSEILGKWALSNKWNGYMGIALWLGKDGYFNYWFYSDVGLVDGPKYPIRGKYKIEDGSLILETDDRIYDKKWALISYAGKEGLFPFSAFETIISRKENPDIRMLCKLPSSFNNVKEPIYNVPNIKNRPER